MHKRVLILVGAILLLGGIAAAGPLRRPLDDDIRRGRGQRHGTFCFYVPVEPPVEQAAACAEFDAEQGTTPVAPGPTNAPVPATPAATPSAVPAPEDENANGSTATIVGGVIAATVAVAAVGGGFVLWRRRGAC